MTEGAIAPTWCVAGKPAKAQIQFDSVRDTYGDGPDLIRDWFLRGRIAGNPFEGFIFTWIAFNGWAERATGLERDWEWIQTLAVSSRLRDDFDELLEWNPVAQKAVRRLMMTHLYLSRVGYARRGATLGCPIESRGGRDRSRSISGWRCLALNKTVGRLAQAGIG